MVSTMEEIILYPGNVNNELFNEFYEKKGGSLFNHACNCCEIEDFLAISYVLCPDIIEVNGYVFLADLFEERGKEAINEIRRLERQFNYCKKDIERWVNSISLGEFFFGRDTPSMDNDKILQSFGEVLVYNWTKRFHEVFPNKNIVIEIGNEIMGELGLTITIYED